MVYHEKDRLFGVHVGASKDQKMLIEHFRSQLVVSEKRAALIHFRVLDFFTHKWSVVSLPETVYAASRGDTPEFGSHTFRFTYQCMITPESVYDYSRRQPSNTPG
jgi:protease II